MIIKIQTFISSLINLFRDARWLDLVGLAALHGGIGMLLEHLRLGHASDGLGSEVEGRILQRLVAHIELRNLHRKLAVGLVRLVHHVGMIALDLLQRLVVVLPVGLSLRFYR